MIYVVAAHVKIQEKDTARILARMTVGASRDNEGDGLVFADR